MTDSRDSTLPPGWVQIEIENVLAPQADGRLLHHGWSPQCEAVPRGTDDEWGVLKTTAVQDGAFAPEHNKRLPTALSPRPGLEVREGDLLLTCAGPRARCGIACLVRRAPKRLILSGKMYRFRVREELITPAFLEAQLLSTAAKSAIDAMKTGISDSGLNLTLGRFLRLTTRVPPLPEQRRIVEFLETQFTRLDAAVATLKRVRANLKRYRAAVLQAAAEGRLVKNEAELARDERRTFEPGSVLLKRILAECRSIWEVAELAKLKTRGQPPKDDHWRTRYAEPVPPDTDGLHELPEGWIWTTAAAVCPSVASGSTPEASELHQDVGEIPFIKVYNLTFTGVLDFTVSPTFVDRTIHNGLLARSRVFPGDVLTNIVGPPLGKVSVVPPSFPEWNINQAIVAFRPCSLMSTAWIKSLLLCRQAQEWLKRTSKTTTSQVNLSVTNCRRLPIPLPPQAEQSRIVQELERLLSIEFAATRSLDQLEMALSQLRKSLLRTAFDGSLVPQDPRDEPASVLLERIRREHAAESSAPRNRSIRSRQ